MNLTELLAFLAALFSMMNPIGGVGIFAGMTADRSRVEARAIARNCAVAAMITLLVVIWTGGALLKTFGITVDDIRTAGGLIVLIIGLHMLFNKAEHKSSPAEIDKSEDIAIVPLAIPLVAGPGTMATVLVYAQHHAGWLAKLEMSAASIAICVLVGLLFSFAGPISSALGKSGMAVVTRVMGMILMAIAVGMVRAGLVGMFPSL